MLSDMILSEKPFIDNIGDRVITGYRVEVKYKDTSDIKDLYEYLAGCIDAGLEDVTNSGEKITFVLKCRSNSNALNKLSIKRYNGRIAVTLDTTEVLEKLVPRLRNRYVVHKIEAVARKDYDRYHSIVKEESQADEVLGQLAVEEILFSSRRDEYEKILSIKPEEARFQQRLLRELVGCGR